MRFSLKQLQRARVETISGTFLGHVSDVIFDTEGQTILQYAVKSIRWVGTTLLIGREQIIRFETNRLLVDDSVANEQQKPVVNKTKRGIAPEPVAMMEKTG